MSYLLGPEGPAVHPLSRRHEDQHLGV